MSSTIAACSNASACALRVERPVRCTPEAIAAALHEVDTRQLRRRRELADDGSIDFCSNDYLGLARHPELAQAMAEAALRDGVGARASHLVSGHCREHEALEQELAEFTGRERALVFSTGYMANLGVLAALADRDDLVLEDRLNHASLIDAALLARTRHFKRYLHGDAAAAARALSDHAATAHEGSSALLVTDGVFSMDGDLAPLPQLVAAARQHGAWLIVDDAHGIGVLGERGAGCCEFFGLDALQVPVLIGTFGKALGSFGAFVAGDEPLIELLIQRARTYIYTTALPPAVAAATRKALQLVQRESWRREKLHELIAQFREGATRRGLPLTDSPTAIQPLILGSAASTLAASAALRVKGYRVTAIRPPTVPQGSARLRVTLSATHEPSQVEALLVALEASLQASREAGA
jgi:8-amino-7-oxononanoate synthase